MSRDMKDSGIEWMGKIPMSWNTTKVKNAFVRKKSKPTTENYNILSLARSGIKIRDISTGEGQIASDYSHYNPVIPGDILLNPMDLVSGDNSNISEVEGVISQAYFNLRAKHGYNPYFYNYYFKLQYWLGSFFSHGKGVSFKNRWTLNAETVSNFPILIPSLDEQNMIVNFLDEKTSEIEDIVEKTKQSIEGLKAYKQSLITETVTKGLDPDIDKKDSKIINVSSIPIHWNTAKLGNIAKLQTGTTPSTKNEILFDGEYNWYTPSDLNDFILRGSSRKLNRIAIDEKIVPKYPKNSVLVVGIGATIGKVAFSDHECSSNQQITAVIPNTQLEGKYLAYYMLVNTSLIRNTAQYTTLPIINNNNLSKIFIIIPPLIEQKEIVDYLDEKTKQINNVINKKQQMIEELESYKQSLIYEYVTGKKEVK